MTQSRELPSKEVLDQLLKYDWETGEFFWRPRPVSLMLSGKTKKKEPKRIGSRTGIGPLGPRDQVWSANQWNSRWAGKPATSLKRDGYRYVSVLNRPELAHRVAYKIMTGLDPVEIDHVNGDRGDNRWVNLKNGTRSDNLRNVALKRNNTSGCHGVRFDKRQQKWVASIHIGSFDSQEEAVEARKRVEVILGYHPNHGREFVDRTRPADLVMPHKSASGIRGVMWNEEKKSWMAQIWVNKKCHHLGYFETKEEAIAARQAAENIRDRRGDFSDDEPTQQ